MARRVENERRIPVGWSLAPLLHVPSNAKNGDATGITAVDDCVMAEDELPESWRARFDGLSDVREIANSPERRLEHITVSGPLTNPHCRSV